jgi:SAM-dependent methyltransferase
MSARNSTRGLTEARDFRRSSNVNVESLAFPNEESRSKNRAHYDTVFQNVDIDRIASRVGRADEFLEDAIKTFISWHGLYQGGFSRRIRGKKVLEIGCGSGLNAMIMAALGAEVVANDASPHSERVIREVSSRLGLTAIECRVGDFTVLPLGSDSFDFVVGKAFLHHLPHDLEEACLAKVATVLKPAGEARFFEPAVNSVLLDRIRWMVPVPGRPSVLRRKAFAEFKRRDPHPDRDNSSTHYARIGNKYFEDVRIVPFGSLERLQRLLPPGELDLRYRRWAHQAERRLPMALRMKAARSQLISYRSPRTRSTATSAEGAVSVPDTGPLRSRPDLEPK